MTFGPLWSYPVLFLIISYPQVVEAVTLHLVQNWKNWDPVPEAHPRSAFIPQGQKKALKRLSHLKNSKVLQENEVNEEIRWGRPESS